MAKEMETQRKSKASEHAFCVFVGVAGSMQFLTPYLKSSDVRIDEDVFV